MVLVQARALLILAAIALAACAGAPTAPSTPARPSLDQTTPPGDTTVHAAHPTQPWY